MWCWPNITSYTTLGVRLQRRMREGEEGEYPRNFSKAEEHCACVPGGHFTFVLTPVWPDLTTQKSWGSCEGELECFMEEGTEVGGCCSDEQPRLFQDLMYSYWIYMKNLSVLEGVLQGSKLKMKSSRLWWLRTRNVVGNSKVLVAIWYVQRL